VIFDDLRAIQFSTALAKAELEGLSQLTQTPLRLPNSQRASFILIFILRRQPNAERFAFMRRQELSSKRPLRVARRTRRVFRQFTARRRQVSVFVLVPGRCDHAPAVSSTITFTDCTAAHAERIARCAIRAKGRSGAAIRAGAHRLQSRSYGDG